jgi:hypothetical protein
MGRIEGLGSLVRSSKSSETADYQGGKSGRRIIAKEYERIMKRGPRPLEVDYNPIRPEAGRRSQSGRSPSVNRPADRKMSRDLRNFSRQTRIRLLAGFILILLIVGSGLVYLFFGLMALPTYYLCLAVGLVPLVLIWLVLSVMEWLVKRDDR